jgi:hypothetical protein
MRGPPGGPDCRAAPGLADAGTGHHHDRVSSGPLPGRFSRPGSALSGLPAPVGRGRDGPTCPGWRATAPARRLGAEDFRDHDSPGGPAILPARIAGRLRSGVRACRPRSSTPWSVRLRFSTGTPWRAAQSSACRGCATWSLSRRGPGRPSAASARAELAVARGRGHPPPGPGRPGPCTASREAAMGDPRSRHDQAVGHGLPPWPWPHHGPTCPSGSSAGACFCGAGPWRRAGWAGRRPSFGCA